MTLPGPSSVPSRCSLVRNVNIEVWFSILSRKCLRRADFADASIATQQIEAFMATYNTHMTHPFEWRKGVRFY
jgi:hypothetical protein